MDGSHLCVIFRSFDLVGAEELPTRDLDPFYFFFRSPLFHVCEPAASFGNPSVSDFGISSSQNLWEKSS